MSPFITKLAFGIAICGLWACSSGAAVQLDSTHVQWSWPASIVVPLFLTGLSYALGFARMWPRKNHAGVSAGQVACFATGWLSLLLALDSPIHELGEQLFSAHMVQHEALMLICAPLLLLGRPWIVFLWVLPQEWRQRFSFRHSRGWWHIFTTPVVAWLLHAVCLWAWHGPVLFNAALRYPLAHAAQHSTFLAAAGLFWWPIMGHPRQRLSDGAAILYVFTTATHMSILGALLTFAPKAWYGSYSLTAPWRGLTALQDQQIGGLIMWIPAGTILFGATLFLLHRWMQQSDERWQLGRTAKLLRDLAGKA